MTTSERLVAVVTGTRADYGLLRWTMEEIRVREGLELRTIVTGSHLEPQFGETWREIDADGLPIDERVHLHLDDDSPLAVSHALGRAVCGLSDALTRLEPDIVLLFGDRYETFAAAQAAMMLGLPIAHIHGGERTEGAIDEAIRHAVTKLAHLHFVAADEHARRVVQMGEAPERVFVVGAPALDAFERLEVLTGDALEQALGFALGHVNLLVTFQPETLSSAGDVQVEPLLAVLAVQTEATIVITGSNADPGGRAISARLRRFASDWAGRVHYVESLGQRRYLSLLLAVDAVLGNSSSGLIEAPVAGTAVVNIGDRQRGRLRAPAVIDCPNDADAISEALALALSADHRAVCSRRETPYGTPGAARRITDVLAGHPLEGILLKRFFDVAEPHDGLASIQGRG